MSLTGNLGDTRTTITHPSTTTHGRLTEDQRQAAGIQPGLIRLSIGLEAASDLIADLSKGWRRFKRWPEGRDPVFERWVSHKQLAQLALSRTDTECRQGVGHVRGQTLFRAQAL